MVHIKRKEPNTKNTSKYEKGDNLTTVSATLLISQNIKFYEISAKQQVY